MLLKTLKGTQINPKSRDNLCETKLEKDQPWSKGFQCQKASSIAQWFYKHKVNESKGLTWHVSACLCSVVYLGRGIYWLHYKRPSITPRSRHARCLIISLRDSSQTERFSTLYHGKGLIDKLSSTKQTAGNRYCFN